MNFKGLSVCFEGLSVCELCGSGTHTVNTQINEQGHVTEQIESCKDTCPKFVLPSIVVPNDWEPYRIKKNVYGFRPINEQPEVKVK